MKSARTSNHPLGQSRKRAMRMQALALLLVLQAAGPSLAAPPVVVPPPANQLPTGPQVSAGSVSVTQTQTPNAGVMGINQSSPKAIVNWNTFNVGSGAKVNITQPSSSSTLLNRVQDSNPSQIFGQINANGQVFLTNPNGVYFAPGASVDVGSFTATTNAISDADFLAGKYNLSRNGATGSILNQGSLIAGLDGYIALLAPEVVNQGVVVAKLGGTVAMAAGDAYQLQFNTNNRLTNVLVSPGTFDALVDNGRAVRAPGGLIILSAQSASSLLGGVVRNSGTLAVDGPVDGPVNSPINSPINGPVNDGGTVRLSASNTIVLAATSSISADAAASSTGNSAGNSSGNGGRIEVIADLANPASSIVVDGSVSAQGAGVGGALDIRASNVTLKNTATLSVNAANSSVQAAPATQGGQITIVGNKSLSSGATLQANADSGGMVLLVSPDGEAQNTGTVQANGAEGLGGTIVQSGLTGTSLLGATLQANGALGGGNIVIGRDFKTNPLSGSAAQAALLPSLSSVIGVPTSASTVLDASSSLSANALRSGNGGTLLVWGDNNTVGGALSTQVLGGKGNGGFIETSGHRLTILDTATVSTASRNGTVGVWLLDPNDFTIAASGGDITGATIQTALQSSSVAIYTDQDATGWYGTNVTVTGTGTSNGSGDLNVFDTISWSSNTLLLHAYNNINVGSSTKSGKLAISGTGSLMLVACGVTHACAGYPSTLTEIRGAADGTGYVLMGMSSSPTTSLLANQNGFNGQITVSGTGATPYFSGNGLTAGTPILINGKSYSPITTEAGFVGMNSAYRYYMPADLAFSTSYTASPYNSNFAGNFNGFGHAITGLNLNIGTPSTSNPYGLFKYSEGKILNLGVGGSITTTVADNCNCLLVGGLVGNLGYNGTTQGVISSPLKNSIPPQSK